MNGWAAELCPRIVARQSAANSPRSEPSWDLAAESAQPNIEIIAKSQKLCTMLKAWTKYLHYTNIQYFTCEMYEKQQISTGSYKHMMGRPLPTQKGASMSHCGRRRGPCWGESGRPAGRPLFHCKTRHGNGGPIIHLWCTIAILGWPNDFVHQVSYIMQSYHVGGILTILQPNKKGKESWISAAGAWVSAPKAARLACVMSIHGPISEASAPPLSRKPWKLKISLGQMF